MIDRESVMQAMKDSLRNQHCGFIEGIGNVYAVSEETINDTLELLKEQEKEIKSLCLLVEWAEECDFGFDQFPDEYERYKDEINGMKYIDGMIHIAKRTLEDHGAFEKGL